MAATSEDLSARPNAASQLAGMAVAVVLIDPEGRVADANPAAQELLGRGARRLAGERLAQIPEAGPAGQSLFARAIPLSPTRSVDVANVPLHDHPGWRVVTLTKAVRDVTPAEKTVLRAPAILAHEIKNPLAAIKGAAQLLARRLEPREQALADIITGEVDRLAALVDRMQQLGRAASVASVPCNLHEVIRKALAGVRTARGGAVGLVEAFDPSLPAVAADADALQQVLMNLIINACDACENLEQPRVVIRTRFVSGQYGFDRAGAPVRLPIEIAVIDNGPGVPPDLVHHIFEPFVTSKSHGQGLGLALVRKLVRDMGGRVAYDRDSTAGLTAFRINLAVASAAAGS